MGPYYRLFLLVSVLLAPELLLLVLLLLVLSAVLEAVAATLVLPATRCNKHLPLLPAFAACPLMLTDPALLLQLKEDAVTPSGHAR